MESQLFSQTLQSTSARRGGGRSAAHHPPHQRGAAAGGAVAFADPADGRQWTVVEQPGDRIPGARGPSCLCFQAQDVFRRVWRFPANWRDLSAAELAALSRSW